jgi:ferritin-like metal-binding protein YciE
MKTTMEENTNQRALFMEHLEELWSMEQLILESMPAMIVTVEDFGLKQILRSHYAETLNQTSMLRGIAKQLQIQLQLRETKLFDSTLAEADEIVRHGELTPSPDLDRLIIAMCKRIEEYEIEQYSKAALQAGELSLQGVQKTLLTILTEEKLAKVKLDFVDKNLTDMHDVEHKFMTAL